MAETSSAAQFAKLPVSGKIGLLFLLLLLLGAMYFGLLQSPLDTEIETARNRKIQLEEELSQAKQLQQRFLQLREELETRKLADQRNLRVLPDRAEIAEVLQELNRIAELSGLEIQSVEPETEKASEFYFAIPVKLKLAGRYHQLSKFFYNVSRLQRAINMENISLRDPVVEGEDIILEVEVLATTFRRKEA